MFSQDEYRSTCCPSHVINFNLHATTHINLTLVGRLILPAVQLREDRWSSIPTGAPLPRLMLFYFIPHSIPPCCAPQFPSALLSQDSISSISFRTRIPLPISVLLNTHQCTSVRIVASKLNSAHLTPPPPLSLLLRLLGCCSIPVSGLQLRFGTAQCPSAFLSLDFAHLFILRSFNTFCILLSSTKHSPSDPPLLHGGCSPFSS
jgi:hypothetical protein